jgi:hypothetical protein
MLSRLICTFLPGAVREGGKRYISERWNKNKFALVTEILVRNKLKVKLCYSRLIVTIMHLNLFFRTVPPPFFLP